MDKTNNEFAQDIQDAFSTLHTSLLSAFEMYLKNFNEKSEQIEVSFGKIEQVNSFKKRIKEIAKDEKKKDEVEALNDLVRSKENEGLLRPGDKPTQMILKRKILSEQTVVYCSSVFESFRVRLVTLLFKNNEGARDAYIRVFKEAALKWYKKTNDQSFTQAMEKDMVLPKNLKLIQNSGKLRDVERLMYKINLNEGFIDSSYQKNTALSVLFREVRNIVVHRNHSDELRVDDVFYSAVKHGVGFSYVQQKKFKSLFEDYMFFPWEKNSARLHLSPRLIFHSIVSLINLSYLYCFSIANNNGFYFNESLFNDVCVDYYENGSKNIYIGFFVEEDIQPLFSFQKNKDVFNDTVTLVNYAIASNILKEHYADNEKLRTSLDKTINDYCSLIKKMNKNELIYNIITSFLKKDLVSLTKAADEYLKKYDYNKHHLTDWFIFRSLKDIPFIVKYLNSPLV